MASIDAQLEAAFTAHRPAILRHCYRMLGSFAEAEELTQDTLERAWRARSSFEGSAPLQHWLFRIATNSCLNALAQRKRRALPQLECAAATDYDFEPGELDRWIAPAPDAVLFPHGFFARDPEQLADTRESVTLAFLELLQRLPPKQRAALLLKDVVGWSAEEISAALELSVSAVNSALNRARNAAVRAQSGPEQPGTAQPSPQTVAAFVNAWEARDLDALAALLKHDVTLAMPPYAAWFEGAQAVVGFFRSRRFDGFWSSLARVVPTYSNGGPAFLFELDGARTHSVMLVRFDHQHVAEMVTFVGEAYFQPFRCESAG